jgi:uncharacterized phage protein (TIGR02220 family)
LRFSYAQLKNPPIDMSILHRPPYIQGERKSIRLIQCRQLGYVFSQLFPIGGFKMNKRLINEAPLIIIPSLAVKIGLNESVILQQVHYWLQSSKHVFEGRKWVYNTYQDWQKQLPFLSESTIRRAIRFLEKEGYLISASWNKTKMGRTKWYTIDYEKLKELGMEPFEQTPNDAIDESVPSCGQIDARSESERSEVDATVNQAIPKTTTETTTETKIPYKAVIDYLNGKTGAGYKPGSKKSKTLIRARWREGFRLEDFQKVIDLKTAEWLHDPQWSKFLRPETLFGSKFESYLNQKPIGKKWREEDFQLDD